MQAERHNAVMGGKRGDNSAISTDPRLLREVPEMWRREYDGCVTDQIPGTLTAESLVRKCKRISARNHARRNGYRAIQIIRGPHKDSLPPEMQTRVLPLVCVYVYLHFLTVAPLVSSRPHTV